MSKKSVIDLVQGEGKTLTQRTGPKVPTSCPWNLLRHGLVTGVGVNVGEGALVHFPAYSQGKFPFLLSGHSVRALNNSLFFKVKTYFKKIF